MIYHSHTIARRACLALAWAVLLVFIAAASVRPAQAQTADTLDVNALIHITTAGEPDVSGDFTIDTNGDITMLYVNQVHLAGLTVAQARETVTKALSKFYRNPQVVVTLLKAGGVAVEVTGAVANQGSRVVRSDTRLNDVMQLAAPTLDADLTQVEITHGRPGETKTKDTVDYLSYVNDKNVAGNPDLRDGDKIFVPLKVARAIEINLRGEVAKPGRHPYAATTTVYDAIQQAGGLTIDANRKGIYIQHPGSTEQIPFDIDAARQQQDNPQVNPVLLDGDTILIKGLETPSVFTIVGAVHHPGEFPLTVPKLSLTDAIGKADGLADRARMKEVKITRKAADGTNQVIPIDASDPTVRANTFIQRGDNIEIPQGRPAFAPDPLTVLGTVIGLYGIFRR